MILGLTMIVKDADDVIERTLSSIKPYIDRWYILDTGSTDRTKDIIHKVMDGVEGKLYEEPFTDFSSARNSILDKAGTECKYVIMLDDSYELAGGGDILRNTLKTGEFNAYHISIRAGPQIFSKLCVLKTESNLRYKYRVHETINVKSSKQMNPEVDIIEHIPERHKQRSKDRMPMDIQKQLLDLNDYPNDPRVVYYIAQSYSVLEDWDRAEEWYTRRTYLFGGHPDDLYNAYYKLGLIQQTIRKSDSCVKNYMKASQIQPLRAEPYYSLSDWYYESNPVLSYFMADAGSKLPRPVATLYYSVIYDVGIDHQLVKTCYKVGKRDQGIEAFKRLEKNYPEFLKSDTRYQEYVKEYSQ